MYRQQNRSFCGAYLVSISSQSRGAALEGAPARSGVILEAHSADWLRAPGRCPASGGTTAVLVGGLTAAAQSQASHHRLYLQTRLQGLTNGREVPRRHHGDNTAVSPWCRRAASVKHMIPCRVATLSSLVAGHVCASNRTTSTALGEFQGGVDDERWRHHRDRLAKNGRVTIFREVMKRAFDGRSGSDIQKKTRNQHHLMDEQPLQHPSLCSQRQHASS